MGWVMNQAECTPECVLEALRKVVEPDVERRNRRLKLDRRFRVRRFESGVFEVRSGTYPRIDRRPPSVEGFVVADAQTVSFAVTVCVAHGRIAIGWSGPFFRESDEIHIFPRWNSETESCLLRCKGKPVTLDQISQLALEPIFSGET